MERGLVHFDFSVVFDCVSHSRLSFTLRDIGVGCVDSNVIAGYG